MPNKQKISYQEHQARNQSMYPIGSYHQARILSHKLNYAVVDLYDDSEDSKQINHSCRGRLYSRVCSPTFSRIPIGKTTPMEVVGYIGVRGQPLMAWRPHSANTWSDMVSTLFLGQSLSAVIASFSSSGGAIVRLTSRLKAAIAYEPALDRMNEGDRVTVVLAHIDSDRQRIMVKLKASDA
jgi:pantothenate kinase